MIGQTISHYPILEKIGSGGMGNGAIGHMTNRLRRDLALKVLPEAVARDIERMVRFRRIGGQTDAQTRTPVFLRSSASSHTQGAQMRKN